MVGKGDGGRIVMVVVMVVMVAERRKEGNGRVKSWNGREKGDRNDGNIGRIND